MKLPVKPKDDDDRDIIDADGKYVCFANTTEARDLIVQAINSYEKQKLHIESLKAICEAYIPADQMDKANDELILLCEKTMEEIGRKLLAKQALKEKP